MFILSPILSMAIITADVQIEHVVPDTTIAFISTPSIAQLAGNLKETGVCDAIQGLMTTVCEPQGLPNCFEEDGQCSEFFNTLGIDKENLTPPDGYAGFAIYPVIDYEDNSVGIGLIGMMELDEEVYGDLISSKQEEYLESLGIGNEMIELSGRDVWMFENDSEAKFPVPELNVSMNSFDRGYFVYSDGYVIVGTDPDTIAAVSSAIDGDPETHTLADHPDFTSLVDRCGTDGDIFAGVLLTNLSDMIVQLDQTGMAMMFLPTIKTLFGDVDAIAESVQISPSSDVFIEATYTALMNDGRSGLVGLLGDNALQQPIPSFVQTNAISYSQGQIDLNKVVPLIKETIMSNPMLGMQMAPQLELMETGLNSLLDPLGQTYHSYSTGQLPITADSIGYLVAIECTNEEAFSTTLNNTLPAMGAQSTDFLGTQIFTIDLGAGLPMPMPMSMNVSIAVSGGYAMLGLSHTVEEALRTIANPQEYKRSRATNVAESFINHGDVSSWGYADLAKSMQIQTALSESMANDMFDEMESFDPEMAEEMRSQYKQELVIQTLIAQTITSLLGPMSWDLSTDTSGVNAKVVMLKSSDE